MPRHAPSLCRTKLLYTPYASAFKRSTTTCNPLSYGAVCSTGTQGKKQAALECTKNCRSVQRCCDHCRSHQPQSSPPLHTCGKRNNGSISAKRALLRIKSNVEELLCCWLRTPNAVATLCTPIKFSFFFPFWRQMNMAAQHYTWQYANYIFYLPPTRNIVFFFLSKCILHMYTHTNKSSCDLPSPPISKKEKEKSCWEGRIRNESRPPTVRRTSKV